MVLLDLPNELLASIAEHLSSEKDINAFAQSNRRIYSLLIDQLYRFNILRFSCSALPWAAERGFENVVLRFFPCPSQLKIRDYALKRALVAATRCGNERITKILLENGVDAKKSTNKNYLPITLAAASGNLTVVKLLVEYGAEMGKSVRSSWCAMDFAASNGHLEIMQFIGINEQALRRTTKDGCTILHRAAEGGHDKVVRYLIDKGADLAATDGERRTPLIWAMKDNPDNIRVMETILSYESALGVTTDRELALNAAIFSNSIRLVKMLLDHGAKVTGTSWDVPPPVVAAVYSQCSLDIIELLIRHGADVSAPDYKLKSPLFMAAYLGRIETIRFLLDKGADKTAPDKDGRVPLHMAARNGHLEAVGLLLCDDIYSKAAHDSESAQFPEDRAKVDVADDEGITPLMTAVMSIPKGEQLAIAGHAKFIKYFLEKGADSNGNQGYRGDPPLHVASGKGKVDIVKLLINHGANIDRKARNNVTALHVAAQAGHVEIVGLLLQKGAKLKKTSSGETALNWANENGKFQVAKLLEEHISVQ